MTTSGETKEVFGAFVKCQADIEGALKDATNPAFKSKYADLSSVIEAARKPLKDSGLALTMGLTATDAGVALEALLIHASGQFIKYDPFVVMVTKKDAQGQGSAVTYGRRYLTMSILGIPAEDDDGDAATKPAPQPARAAAPRAETPAPAPKPAPASAKNAEYEAIWLKGGVELKNTFKTPPGTLPVFSADEVETYRKEWAALRDAGPNMRVFTDAFLGKVKAELAKRAEA